MYEPILKPKDKPRGRESLRYELVCDGAAKKYPDGREVCCDTPKGKDLYRRRVQAMARRQKWVCAICGRPFTELEPPTFGHDKPRRMGAGFRDDRIIDESGAAMNHAEHEWCNAVKGSKR